MTPRCQDVLERLVEAATGSLPPAARSGIAEHLAICPRCRNEAAALEATAARLRQAGRFTAPPDFWTEFMEGLAARLARERQPWPLRLRRWVAAPRHAWATLAATAVVVLVIAAAIRLSPPPAPAPDPIADRARGLVTETMVTTLPSLRESLETWRAGLTVDVVPVSDRTGP